MRWLTGVLLLSQAAGVGAQQPTQRRSSSTQEAVTAVRRATVTISVTRPDSQGLGSGFVVTSDGVIATAAHVIRGATTASVRLPSGESYDVQGIIAIDEARDFALLRIAGFGLPIVTLGNSDSIPVGSRLLAFGAPLGFEATVSDGLLSATRLKEGTRLFQISVPISPGSSGGPVTTEDGLVMAIVVATWREEGAQNLNFALPINYLRGQIPLASGKTPVPLSQMSYQPAGPVSRVEPGGLAAAPRTTRVNDSLGVDWRILDGVQIRAEVKRDQGIRVTDLAEYALSRTPQGRPALERIAIQTAWQTADIFSGRKSGTWYQDNARTVLELEGAGAIESYWRRAPGSNQVPPGSLTVTVDRGMVVVDSVNAHRTGSVPPGSLPIVLLGAVVASLPDSLPNSVYIWFFNPSSSPIRAEPVRIEFANRNRLQIPRARAGTRCSSRSQDEDTEDTAVDVVEMTATVGADRLSWPVLARRPHVRLQDAKCVRLP